jgi:CubicO group peptidase (beta-lactamase class C family)
MLPSSPRNDMKTILKALRDARRLALLLAVGTAFVHAPASADREKRYPIESSYRQNFGGQGFGTRQWVGTLTHLHTILPTCTVHPSDKPFVIEKTAGTIDFKFKRLLVETSLRAFEESADLLGVTIFDGQRIVHQRFFSERNADDLMPSFSMAKSLISMMVGIALDEGKIRSLDDKVSDYAPRLAQSSYGNTTIRNLLRMSSGVPYSEAYSGSDDQDRFQQAATSPTGSVIDAIHMFKRAARNPGAEFNYASIETTVLAEVVRAATGIETCRYFEEKIWKPIGARAAAYWVTDSRGDVLGHNFFLANQDDFLKLGILLANGGEMNGKRIVSNRYIQEATDVTRQPPAFQFGKANRISGYGYQFWLGAVPGRFAMIGIRGQSMYIDQATRKIILINSADDRPVNPLKSLARYNMFEAYVAGDSQK